MVKWRTSFNTWHMSTPELKQGGVLVASQGASRIRTKRMPFSKSNNLSFHCIASISLRKQKGLWPVTNQPYESAKGKTLHPLLSPHWNGRTCCWQEVYCQLVTKDIQQPKSLGKVWKTNWTLGVSRQFRVSAVDWHVSSTTFTSCLLGDNSFHVSGEPWHYWTHTLITTASFGY